MLLPGFARANSTVFGDGNSANKNLAYFCFNNGCYDSNGRPVTVIVYNAQLNDVSSNYANVGGTIYKKSTAHAFSSPAEFFSDSGVISFNGLVFDTTWRANSETPLAPVVTPSPILPTQPIIDPVTPPVTSALL